MMLTTYSCRRAGPTLADVRELPMPERNALGGWRDTHWVDGWTAVTKDGLPSAQFEHTLLITETGVDILTARLPTSPPLWWELELEAAADAAEAAAAGSAAQDARTPEGAADSSKDAAMVDVTDK